MDLAFRHILYFAVFLFSALFLHAEKAEASVLQNEISNMFQHDEAFKSESKNYDFTAYLHNQFRITKRVLRHLFPSENRRLFLIVALFLAQSYIVYKKSVKTTSLAITSQPHADYYLYMLGRIRI